ncbi:hypothetical protein KUCAC02_015329, partial [Chaenocephalus aceratus]
ASDQKPKARKMEEKQEKETCLESNRSGNGKVRRQKQDEGEKREGGEKGSRWIKAQREKNKVGRERQAERQCQTLLPLSPVPAPPHHFHPASPTLPLSSSSSSGNGKRASSSSQLQTQTPPQQQCQLSSASARYPPREVPPRFRQQEHKQLLKRGQLAQGLKGQSHHSHLTSAFQTLFECPQQQTETPCPLSPPCITPTIPVSPADWGPLSSRQPAAVQTDSPVADISLQSGCIAQYETSHWGASLPVDSCSSANSWDKVNIDKSDTEAWPSINHSRDTSHTAAQECTLGSASSNTDNSAVTTTSSCRNLSMATGAAGQPAHYPSLKANNNMMTGHGSANTCG